MPKRHNLDEHEAGHQVAKNLKLRSSGRNTKRTTIDARRRHLGKIINRGKQYVSETLRFMTYNTRYIIYKTIEIIEFARLRNIDIIFLQ